MLQDWEMEVEGIGIVRRRILVEEVRFPERHLETSGQPNYSVTSTDTSNALESVPAPSTSSPQESVPAPVHCSKPGPIPVPTVSNAQEFIPSFFTAPGTSSVSISTNKSETVPIPPASSAPDTGLTPAPSSTAEILPVQPPRSSDAAKKTLPVPVSFDKPETVPVTTSGDSQITPGIRSLSVRCGDASAPCPGVCSFCSFFAKKF